MTDVIAEDMSDAPSPSSSRSSGSSGSSISRSGVARSPSCRGFGPVRLERLRVRKTSYLNVGGKLIGASLNPLKNVPCFMRALS